MHLPHRLRPARWLEGDDAARRHAQGEGLQAIARADIDGFCLHAAVRCAADDRVFDLDLERCPNCGGEHKIIAAILEQPVIEKILTHLGLQDPQRSCARLVDAEARMDGSRMRI